MDYIAFLQDAIRTLHGCESEHIETVHVDERFQGQQVWKGDVEIFTVPDHQQADRLYAWIIRERDDRPDWKAITVLEVPPITTPRKAVQAYIASVYRKEQQNNAN
jgi:hypothetical protein